MRFIFSIVALLALNAVASADDLASKAQLILTAHCYRCHGQDGSLEGGFNYVLDTAKLADRKKIVAGKPEASPLLKRIAAGTMPPVGETMRPSDTELATLKEWIAAGAAGTPAPQRKSISTGDTAEFIRADLDTLDRRSRRFVRYFSLAHLWNAGLGDDELQTYRNALAKLVNSLSWHPKQHNPEPVDPHRTILRIDLRWYLWDANLWNRALNDYPYGILDDSAGARTILVNTATKVPVVRVDWFVATASRAPLYYDMLQMPANLPELEKQLRVDANLNIQQERVARLGFNGSGISRFNRVLERHDALNGAYWRTYDFDEPPQNLVDRTSTQPADRRNVFAFPLGPNQVESSFQHAGGEAIFALPNGLHAYIIVNAKDQRLDKAPTAIVTDPKRPDRAVEAGVSCMGCHITGILPKADQVRDHVDKNAKAFSRTEASIIKALYPGKDATAKLMEDDAKKYAEAVAKTGAKVSRFEAVSSMTLKYEADLDFLTAVAEAGVTPEEFRKRIDASQVLRQSLGALRVAGGTVSRPIWVQTFGDVVREFKLGTLFRGNISGAALSDNTGELDPLEASGNVANAVALRPDGKLALIASADRSVRVWDVETKRDSKRLIGHTATVWAAAFSPDGSKAISGSVDGTARIWDLSNAQELFKLEGHDAMVSAVAFSADGTKAITGSLDGSVVWWNALTGKEIRRLDGAGKAVYAISLHPKEKLAAIAAERGIVLWNYATGEVALKWNAHAGAVSTVGYSDDGLSLITGGDDGLVKIWDAKTGKLAVELAGHTGTISSAVLKPGGKWALSAGADGTVKLWDVAAKKEAATFRKHGAPVVGAALLPSGLRTLSVDRDLGTLIWDVSKFLGGSAAPAPSGVPEKIPLIK